MKEEQEKEQENDSQEQEIDLLALARKVWDSRIVILKCAAVGAIIGLIIGLSIPNEYVTTIKLVSEANKTATSNLGALANLAGLNTSNSGNAINPQLYPDIVKSVPFIMDLFNVEVKDKKGKNTLTVKEYIRSGLAVPWWNSIINIPGKTIKGIENIFSAEETVIDKDTVVTLSSYNDSSIVKKKEFNTINLTRAESGLVSIIASRINANLDTKNSVIQISVRMQDPRVSAMLADTVAERLKNYVIAYRTNKARTDLEFAQKLNDEAREEYYAAQKKYAEYSDKNQGVILKSMQTEAERLQNDMQLAFALYNTTAQQLQIAKAKVQEITPVYTILEPATVPLRPASPSIIKYLLGCAFIAAFGCVAWILFGKELVNQFKATKTEASEKSEHEE